MYLWLIITLPATTIFISSIIGTITIMNVLLSCAMKKSKRPYKPGHLPEFLDPNAREADTYYGMRSTVAFPVRGSHIKRECDLKIPKAKANDKNLEANKEIQSQGTQSGSTPERESNRPVSSSMLNNSEFQSKY